MSDRVDAMVEKQLPWQPVFLFAICFTDAVFGGSVRASEGGDLLGFVPSIFSGLTAALAMLVIWSVKDNGPRTLWWSSLALLFAALRTIVFRAEAGTTGDFGPIIFLIALLSFGLILYDKKFRAKALE
ncbi:MAG: hypothetical protein AAFR73_04775 [Pseudomonadota bacterium]